MKPDTRLEKIGTGTYFPRNERGVALLIALAVLVLMAILAVSFYTTQEIEQTGTESARYARSAESIAQGGLEWAIALLESDHTFGYDTDYDVWAPLAKEVHRIPGYLDGFPGGGYDEEVLLRNVTGEDDVDLSELVPGDDARWIFIHDGTHVIGRFAAMITCESGKANLNLVGNKEHELDEDSTRGQCEGVSAAEINLGKILAAINNADPEWAEAIIDVRDGPDRRVGTPGDDDNDGGTDQVGYFNCDDDLDGVTDEVGEGVNEPDERNLDTIVGDDLKFLDLSTALMDVSLTPEARRDALNAIRDYVSVRSQTHCVLKLRPGEHDNDNVWPQFFINEPLVSGTLANNLWGWVFVQYEQNLNMNRLPQNVDYVQVAINIGDFIDEDNVPTQFGTAAGHTRGIDKTPYINEVEASPDRVNDPRGTYLYFEEYGEYIELFNPYDIDCEVSLFEVPTMNGLRHIRRIQVPAGEYVLIGDTGGWGKLPEAQGGALVPVTGKEPRPPSPYHEDLELDNGGVKLTLVLGNDPDKTEMWIEQTEYPPAGNMDDRTAQKDDPRVPDRQYWMVADETAGAENPWHPPGPIEEQFVVYNTKVGSIGHLGFVHTGEPWTTIDMTGHFDVSDWDNVHKERTWLTLYDVLSTLADPKNRPWHHGLININTASEEVLAGIKGLDASKLYRHTHVNYPSSQRRRVFETIAEIADIRPKEGEYIKMSSPATSWQREKVLADIAGLITVRSEVFRVTVLAQAVDRQGHPAAARKLEASVLRTIDTSAAGEASYRIRVLSTRWLSEY